MEETLQRVSTRMSTRVANSTLNYLGATVFTFGCMILMTNAVLSILPFIKPSSGQTIAFIYIEGALSLLSSSLFVLGGFFGLIQLVKAHKLANQKACWGKDLSNTSIYDTNNDSKTDLNVDPPTFTWPPEPEWDDYDLDEKSDEKFDKKPGFEDAIILEYPIPGTMALVSPEMWTDYLHELGFLASTIFFVSSSIYLGASIASIITVVRDGEVSQWIRYPQLVAACGFTVASLMMMIQQQKVWWRPAATRLRWYVNLWNLVGSIGFIICACFGIFEKASWAKYHFEMSYLWGSSAFLLAAFIQWYKTLGKRAIQNVKRHAKQKELEDG